MIKKFVKPRGVGGVHLLGEILLVGNDLTLTECLEEERSQIEGVKKAVDEKV